MKSKNLSRENEELKVVLKDILEWLNSETLKSVTTIAWTHGFCISPENAEVRKGYAAIKNAEKLLGIDGKVI